MFSIAPLRLGILCFLIVFMTACVSTPPLHLAADTGTVEEVEALIQAGADPNEIYTGMAPLEYALWIPSRSGDELVPIVQALIDGGASINSRGYWKPMHYAALYCRPEVIDLLLDNGANIDIRGGDGKTPLYLAVEYESVTCVNHLIDRGANLYLSSNKGTTILQEAATEDEVDGNALKVRYEKAQANLKTEKEQQRIAVEEAAVVAEQEAYQSRLDRTWERDAGLGPEIRRDKYLVAFSNSMKGSKYADADFYAQLLERNGLSIDDSLYYFWGDALLNMGDKAGAMEKLNNYLSLTGRNGQYYSQALSLILEAEQEG